MTKKHMASHLLDEGRCHLAAIFVGACLSAPDAPCNLATCAQGRKLPVML